MERIKTPTRWIDKFAPPAGVGRDGFRDGDPVTGQASTQLEADWFDQLQEEVARAIEGSGLTLDPNNMSQLWEAIQREAGRYVAKAGDTMDGSLFMEAPIVMRPANAGASPAMIYYNSATRVWYQGASLNGTFQLVDANTQQAAITVGGTGSVDFSNDVQAGGRVSIDHAQHDDFFLDDRSEAGIPQTNHRTLNFGGNIGSGNSIEFLYDGSSQFMWFSTFTPYGLMASLQLGSGVHFAKGGHTQTVPPLSEVDDPQPYGAGLRDVLELDAYDYAYTPPLSPEGRMTEAPHRRVMIDIEGLRRRMPNAIQMQNAGGMVADIPSFSNDWLLYAMVNAFKEVAARLDALEGARR